MVPPPGFRYGLSPRVRGNRVQQVGNIAVQRSIPACAGEPASPTTPPAMPAVYPRVCGGTAQNKRGKNLREGLSPRVRGNLAKYLSKGTAPGSIPACAGEPHSASPAAPASTVYPRVCGGTVRALLPDVPMRGLSPRVRGNPIRTRTALWSLWSIPACAGEPMRFALKPAPLRVYPRVCGGTPWPFDNASCYLIRQGNMPTR